MGVTSALVLLAVIWFMTFFIVLPIRIQTQGDLGEIVPGTHAGSPEHHHLKKKAWITTGIAFVLWIIIGGTIISGVITLEDIDMFNRIGPGCESE
ncbi:putative secreted protein [Roseovarius sp. MBR-154]|jgi:predicted secreted protein